MKARLVAAIALSTAVTTNAQAAPSQYLCIVEQSTGFAWDRQTDTWKPQVFAPGRKYILRRLNDDDRKNNPMLAGRNPEPTWGFFQFGGDYPTMVQAACTSSEQFGFACTPFVVDLHFDKDSLRFETVLRGSYTSQGYWKHLQHEDPKRYQTLPPPHDPASHPDDDFIEIGPCSPF